MNNFFKQNEIKEKTEILKNNDIFCKKCGTRLIEGNLYCIECGNKVILEEKSIVNKIEYNNSFKIMQERLKAINSESITFTNSFSKDIKNFNFGQNKENLNTKIDKKINEKEILGFYAFRGTNKIEYIIIEKIVNSKIYGKLETSFTGGGYGTELFEGEIKDNKINLSILKSYNHPGFDSRITNDITFSGKIEKGKISGTWFREDAFSEFQVHIKE